MNSRPIISKDAYRLGILGGSFDPIHLGHKTLAEASLKEAKLDEVIIMPAKVQPFKQHKKVTEDFHRLAMAELTFEGNNKIHVSDYEIHNSVISYTYDTLAYFRKKHPDYDIYFIVGTDSFLSLETWYEGIDLLENFSFIVSVRPGYRESELEEKILKYRQLYGANVIKIEAQMPSISSTEIREKLTRGDKVNDLIPECVERYIKENGLYK